MNRNIKVGLAQMNSHVGSINDNLEKIVKVIKTAKKKKVDLVCFPELALVGYPPEDLLYNSKFLKSVDSAIKRIQQVEKKVSYIIGYPKLINGKLYNVAGVFINGILKYEYQKIYLPNYGVFDEERYFTSGKNPLIFNFKGRSICLTICEDIWGETSIYRNISKISSCDLMINISASPFSNTKQKDRLKLLSSISKKNNLEFAYCNMVGGQDELVFDGGSLFFDSKGALIEKGKDFAEDLVIKNLGKNTQHKALRIKKETKHYKLSRIFSALSIGLKDYVLKNGFQKVVIGISGGVDSALVAAIACDSLGSKNVLGIAMPTRFNSLLSLELAKNLSNNLRFSLKVSEIQEIYEDNLKLLNNSVYGKTLFDITEENLQARIRANILMATSNKLGFLLLSTGNKSETSIGYSTLYGDATGGIAILKDIPKTLVYDLAKYYNYSNPNKLIPFKVITRDPSAELRANQKDSDSLPPYRILDKILELYMEDGMEASKIAKALNIKMSLVKNIVNKLNKSEFKRRQGPIGIKITSKAFGRDRRYPITNGFKEA